MSHATPSEAEVANTLSQLQISTRSPAKPLEKPKSKAVADSWDDELSSGSDTETETNTSTADISRTSTKESSLSPISTLNSADLPNPPPPTPASPQSFDYPDNTPYGLTRNRDSSSGNTTPAKRPDKTTAVAGRLIAAGLGVRAPRRTEEEREYDKVMREQQRKKRDEERQREKAEQEAAEKRKKAIWDD